MIYIKSLKSFNVLDYRKFKNLPSLDYFGLFIDDYCCFQNEQIDLVRTEFPEIKLIGPVFCIEIKPKQGFISNESVDLSICKFRLRQQEKVSF